MQQAHHAARLRESLAESRDLPSEVERGGALSEVAERAI
jgi:hypothetical protein